MCRQSKHDLDEVGTSPRTVKRRGKSVTYQTCKGCSAERHRRYDQSWRGQDRIERTKVTRLEGKPPCTECGNEKVWARGMCQAHYRRWHRKQQEEKSNGTEPVEERAHSSAR